MKEYKLSYNVASYHTNSLFIGHQSLSQSGYNQTFENLAMNCVTQAISLDYSQRKYHGNQDHAKQNEEHCSDL